MILLTRTFSTSCASDLLRSVNELAIPSCKQIINNGDGTIAFEFSSNLSLGEELLLDGLLSSWICPIYDNIYIGGGYEIDDSEISSTALWSSEQINQAIQNSIDSVGSGTVPILQVRNTSGVTDIPLSFTNLNFEETDIETDDTVLKHNNISTDRIDILDDGYYIMAYSMTCDDQIIIRAMLDGITEINGSRTSAGKPNDTNDVHVLLANTFVFYATSGQFVNVQITASSTTENLFAGSTVAIFSMNGVKGDKGDPGSGLLEIQNNGISLPGQYEVVNFVGGISASNTGSNVANVSINQPVFGSNYQYVESTSVSTTTSTSYIEKLKLTTSSLPSGVYRIGWTFKWNHDSTSSDFLSRIQLNDSVDLSVNIIEPTDSAGTFGSTGSGQRYIISDFIHINLSGVNNIDIDFATNNIIEASSIWDVRMELWRVQ